MIQDNRSDSPGHPRAAVDDQGQNDAGTFGFIHLLIALGGEKKLLFGLPLVVMLLAAVLSFVLPTLYTAGTTFLPPQQQSSSAAAAIQQLGAIAGIAGGAANIRRSEDLYLALLRSESLEDALIKRFSLMAQYGVTLRELARGRLRSSMQVSVDKGGLFRVEVTDKDPEFAANIANAYVEELRKLLGTLALTEAQQRRAFFGQQLAGAKEALVKADVAMRSTQERTGLIALDKQAESILRTVAELRAQISSREVQLQAMRNFATPQNADVQRLGSEILALREQLQKIDDGRSRPKAGTSLINAGRVPELGLEYVRALREVKYHEAVSELLARQFEMAKIDEAREGPMVQQIDVASPPETRSKPKRRQIVLVSGFVAALSGLLFALMRIGMRRAQSDRNQSLLFQSLRAAWRFRPQT